jgi:hypothetical protein
LNYLNFFKNNIGQKFFHLHLAICNIDWGGVKVDQAFDKFLLDIVGMETMDRFRNEDKADYLSLCREFEVKKLKHLGFRESTYHNNYVCFGNRCLPEYSTEMLDNLFA